ncbi:hypothetical protein P3U41_06220 [Mammaliicoccus sciuri]|uniref:hypothetical protein n=1 Tax=Mammaliicoccus sciuri TaxID=1296 RepID=UPI002B26441D|nr:hypothetical protein [Mammaliicoccus sciuri]WQL34367.1 hypothetical protein P3U41_06220 [Mammaliicoccus sciuri]WQL61306.1 hypothetical protein P3T96_06220 [Mammaliicoccus sciuri]
MDNIEKLKRILTKELVEKNVDMVEFISCMDFKRELIESGLTSILSKIVKVNYLFTLSANNSNQEDKRVEIHTTIDLSELDKATDSSMEQDILAYIVYGHINSLENEIKQELDRMDSDSNYISEVQEKVQKQLDNKNKFKGEFGLKDGNLYVTGSGFKYMNTPYKPEVLVTPDGLETVVEDDESKSSIVYKGKRTICKVEKKPIEQVKLGSLTLQEKDGKLAVTDKNGSTRFI